LSTGRQFHVCFSSRHYPNISIKHGINLILENQTGHETDITNYIEEELKVGRGKVADEIKNELQKRSRGIFLWVVLVVQILNTECDRGQIHILKKRLKDIPDGLHELLEDILTRDSHNAEQTLLCLQWILYARRPLTTAELYFAIIAGLEEYRDFLTEWDPETVTPEMMYRFILDSSKGLAETTRSKKPTVQFIHESVRDFLFKENSLEAIRSNYSRNFAGFSHDRLKQCCLSYVALDLAVHIPTMSELPKASSNEAKDIRNRVSESFPFLGYAVQNILFHAEAAETLGVEQTSFLQNFPLHKWIHLNNVYEKYEVRRYTMNVTLLYIFADRDLCALMPRLSKEVASQPTSGERYNTPLLAAMTHGNEQITKALIMLATESESGIWHWMINTRGIKGISPLHLALENGAEEIVGMLLDRGANTEARSLSILSGQTPLFWGSKNGNQAIVQLLLEKGANIEAKDHSDRTALILAASNGHEAIVQLLLEKGANLEAKDHSNQTALILAASSGHEAIVNLLLDKGANLEAKDHENHTPLILAIINGHEAMANILLERGADFKSMDSANRQIILPWATQENHEAMVKLLLEKGTDIEAKDNFGLTPLSLAVRNNNEGIINLLLAKGADIEAKDNIGRTPLFWALITGAEATFTRLLERGANIEVETYMGRTLLSWALQNGSEAITKLLLDRSGRQS
jgi:ankyrin repeat protein